MKAGTSDESVFDDQQMKTAVRVIERGIERHLRVSSTNWPVSVQETAAICITSESHDGISIALKLHDNEAAFFRTRPCPVNGVVW